MVTTNDIKFAKDTLADFLIFGQKYYDEHIKTNNTKLVDVVNNIVNKSIDIIYIHDDDCEEDNIFYTVYLDYDSDDVKHMVNDLTKYDAINNEIDFLAKELYTTKFNQEHLGYAGWRYNENDDDTIIIKVYDFNEDGFNDILVTTKELNK